VQPAKITKNLKIQFPEALPVSGQREKITQALEQNQVIIVCGETGSGKTTQLPKICLAMGRGRANGTEKLIGHTQPRRIAATSTAKRIAQEIGSPIGEDVGYQVRFADKTSPTASIKLMTDGILLAETQRDPMLNAYDTIIIDEAHERSLNIDFLLGYLRQLLPKRPDLKVIVTSATIDADRFARHFGTPDQPVPVIEVSGRLFPVELRYRALQIEGKKDTREISEAVVDGINELWGQGPQSSGDILVFLPGEREIRDCTEAIRKDHVLNQRFHLDVLSLFARQSVNEQEKVFQGGGGRRVILATNVAETSLTVPGIRFVIDVGLARVKRYSYRNKVEQLQIEAISQAAANQRAGRCGRVSDGICIRLYAESDYLARPKFSDPEILRSSLAAVILRMRALKLPRIQDFPFIEPPLGRAITDGIQLLEELGAMESEGPRQGALTPIGKQLAALPLDPRVGRMLLAAKEHQALREVLIIATAMASQDPRDRPMEYAQAADAAHKTFADERSEFLSFVRIWDWYQDALVHKQSNRQLENLCKSKFISPRRMREWRDVHGQLHRSLMEQGWKENESAATFEQIHLSLLTGLLGNIAKKSEDDKNGPGIYEGARGIKLNIWPGSTIGKKAGAWILASELVETSRLFARTIAKIEPQWVEKVAAHRLLKSWSDPFWDSRQGEVMAHERGTLYGLPIYHGRKVRFSLKDPEEARRIFIQRALVEAELLGQAEAASSQKQSGSILSFFWHNQSLIKQIEALEHRSRRQDVLVDEELLYAFYDQLLSKDVLSRVSLETWLKSDTKNPSLLKLDKSDLMRHEAAGITLDRYPKTMKMAGGEVQLSYHFEPGSPKDGVTMIVPLALLNQIDQRRCEWLVPGLCIEKTQLYIKSLPQKLRRNCVPLPEYSKKFVERLTEANAFGEGDFLEALIADIRINTQVQTHRADYRPENLPTHCFMNFRLVDEYGRQIDLDRNLGKLRSEHAQSARDVFQEVAASAVSQLQTQDQSQVRGLQSLQALKDLKTSDQNVRSNPSSTVAQHKPFAGSIPSLSQTEQIKDWCFGELPEMLEIKRGKQTLYGYPALVDHQTHCDVEVFDDPEIARRNHRLGLRRLFALPMKETIKSLHKQLPGARDLSLLFMNIGSSDELMTQIIELALDRACLTEPLPNNDSSFKERLDAGKPKLALIAQEIARHALASLQAYADLQKKMSALKALSSSAHADVSAQVQKLIHAQFISETPYESLVHIPRYLKAILMRIEKLRTNPSRDAQLQTEWQSIYNPWLKLIQSQKVYGGSVDGRLDDIRWQLEELRVALFAQELKTPTPMSTKRLQKILESLRK
jgi:ATP-dependent helicase HrpA